MQIVLYQNKSDDNVVNKTLVNPYTLTNASIRGEVDVLNPVIEIVSETNLSTKNYCYLPRYSRYYFITDVKEVRTNVWQLFCHVDVLETYKAQFLPLEAIIARQENEYNLYLNDSEWSVYANRQVLTREFPTGFSDNGYYYLTMAGGYSDVE